MGESSGCRIVELWKNMLARKGQIAWVVNFGPGQARSAGKSYVHTIVGQLLHSHVEKLIDPAVGDESVQRMEEFILRFQRKRSDAHVGAAEFEAGDLLAHFYDVALADDYLPRFVFSPTINDNRERRIGLGGWGHDIRGS